MQIVINSFQGGLANDINAWQAGSFWNSSNIEYRKNSAYIELAKWTTVQFTVSSAGVPTALSYWKNSGTIATDLLAFTSTGKIFTSTGTSYTLASGWIVNIAEANGNKYLIWNNRLHLFLSPTSVTEDVKIFTKSNSTRPVLNFYWDLIIWDGTSLIRYNKDGSFYEDATASTESPILRWLDWTVTSITQIGNNIYVWCNSGTNTNMYIWDGTSPRPSQKVTYNDIPVKNVALLWNQHYWWSSKSDYSIRQVLVWESYSPQTYIKSDYPEYDLETEKDNQKNRMIIQSKWDTYINAIETINDIIMFPWIWRVYWFGRYFPWQKLSFSNDFTLTGTLISAMASGGITASDKDVWWVLAVSILNWTNYDINLINLWQKAPWLWVIYALSGWIESMEYVAPTYADWENSKKVVFSYEIPSANQSIKVYVKYDRASSYTLLRTITSADWTGYKTIEVNDSGKWRTKQLKFELLTTDSSVTPKVYVPITNQQVTVWNKT